jgi:hypothetical protein
MAKKSPAKKKAGPGPKPPFSITIEQPRAERKATVQEYQPGEGYGHVKCRIRLSGACVCGPIYAKVYQKLPPALPSDPAMASAQLLDLDPADPAKTIFKGLLDATACSPKGSMNLLVVWVKAWRFDIWSIVIEPFLGVPAP